VLSIYKYWDVSNFLRSISTCITIYYEEYYLAVAILNTIFYILFELHWCTISYLSLGVAVATRANASRAPIIGFLYGFLYAHFRGLFNYSIMFIQFSTNTNQPFRDFVWEYNSQTKRFLYVYRGFAAQKRFHGFRHCAIRIAEIGREGNLNGELRTSVHLKGRAPILTASTAAGSPTYSLLRRGGRGGG